jgi:hypothetical protein
VIELFIIAASAGLAALAAASEVRSITQETSNERDKRLREEAQLAWEDKEAELAKLERREIALTQHALMLEDQGVATDFLQRELDNIHMQKLMIKAEDLPE